jgi:hypothetical protein
VWGRNTHILATFSVPLFFLGQVEGTRSKRMNPSELSWLVATMVVGCASDLFPENYHLMEVSGGFFT